MKMVSGDDPEAEIGATAAEMMKDANASSEDVAMDAKGDIETLRSDLREKMRMDLGDTAEIRLSKQITYWVRYGNRRMPKEFESDGTISIPNLLTLLKLMDPGLDHSEQDLLNFIELMNEAKERYKLRTVEGTTGVASRTFIQKAVGKAQPTKNKRNNNKQNDNAASAATPTTSATPEMTTQKQGDKKRQNAKKEVVSAESKQKKIGQATKLNRGSRYFESTEPTATTSQGTSATKTGGSEEPLAKSGDVNNEQNNDDGLVKKSETSMNSNAAVFQPSPNSANSEQWGQAQQMIQAQEQRRATLQTEMTKFCDNWHLDDAIRRKLKNLSESSANACMRAWNPPETATQKEYSRIFMKYIVKYENMDQQQFAQFANGGFQSGGAGPTVVQPGGNVMGYYNMGGNMGPQATPQMQQLYYNHMDGKTYMYVPSHAMMQNQNMLGGGMNPAMAGGVNPNMMMQQNNMQSGGPGAGGSYAQSPMFMTASMMNSNKEGQGNYNMHGGTRNNNTYKNKRYNNNSSAANQGQRSNEAGRKILSLFNGGSGDEVEKEGKKDAAASPEAKTAGAVPTDEASKQADDSSRNKKSVEEMLIESID